MHLGGKGEYGNSMLVTHRAQEPEEDPLPCEQVWLDVIPWMHNSDTHDSMSSLCCWDTGIFILQSNIFFFPFSISLHKIWEEQTCPEEIKQQKGFGY